MAASAPEPRVVLDSWAVIAYLDGEEPARSTVGALLSQRQGSRAVMNAANCAEVDTVLDRRAGSQASDKFRHLWIESVDVAEPDAEILAAARIIKSAYWMSRADSVAVATAIHYDAELWTGDPELLCNDRIWQVRDLRGPAGLAASAHSNKRTGLRTSVRQELKHDAIDLLASVRQALTPKHSVAELSDDPGLGL